MNNISSRLKLIAKNNNLNLKQLAYRLSITTVALNNYINNNRLPSTDVLLKIKQMFNEISIDWLLTGNVKEESDIINDESNYRIEELKYTIALQREKIDSLEEANSLLKKEVQSSSGYHIAAEPTTQLKTNK